MDKTVPKKDYREHQGLFMVLESKKVIRKDGELYDVGLDYFGYDPYDQKSFPSYNKKGPLDLIYIADTYGVYSDDLQKNPDGEKSKFIYGGMELLEWNAIMNSKGKDTTLIAEFNTFAAPTEDVPRRVIEDNLGVDWSGWTGRYFPKLDSSEVPDWIKNVYEEKYKEKWGFKGMGIVFSHRLGDIVVLNKDESKNSVEFKLTEEGQEKFKNAKDAYYGYWFDIISPVAGGKTLANYKLKVSKAGEKKLNKAGIPLEFPAVIHNQSKKTYYFAGDYADFPKRQFTKWQGSNQLYKTLLTKHKGFYYRTYVPIMNEILEEIIAEKE